MTKIILEFDGVEEAKDARLAMDGYKWKLAMWDLDQELRSIVKYGSPVAGAEGHATEEEIAVADAMREKIRDILEGYQLNIEM